MKSITTALSLVLLTTTAVQALPCAESYAEYSEKLELMGFTKESCPKDMYSVNKDQYENVCVKSETGTDTTAPAFWATPPEWQYAKKERDGRVFGFTLLYEPPVGFCVLPNLEVSLPFQHPPTISADNSMPSIATAVAEAFKNWVHPTRILF